MANRRDKKEMDLLFQELKKEVAEKGLLEKATLRGIVEMLMVTALFTTSVLSIFLMPPLITVVLFVLTIMRATFISHDLIHGQYLERKKEDQQLSYFFANVIMGISSSWWHNKHNVLHHTFTNIVNKDTDMSIGGGVFCNKQKFNDFFHKHQHILFWGLLPLIYFAFWITSLKYVIKENNKKEIILLGINFLIPISIIAMNGIVQGIFMLVAIYTLWSTWFGLGIITNHLGLEIFQEEDFNKFSFLELQTRTSRNVRGGKIVHWIFGGLNTQIEHHLFPRAPRFYLLEVAKITEDFCIKHNIDYISETPLDSYIELYEYLKERRKV